MTRLPPTLDSAREQDWYGLQQNLIVAHFGHGIAVPQQFQQTLHQKQVDAEPALLAELDSRFTVLGDQIVLATSIDLPPETAEVVGRVHYCGWIGGPQIPPSQLRHDLFQRCVRDRDAFLGKLVERSAGLAPIPPLPEGPAAPPDATGFPAPALQDLGTSPGNVVAADPDDALRLSRSIIPADNGVTYDFAAARMLFQRTLHARFQDALPSLQSRLGKSLAVMASSNLVQPVEQVCHAVLGPYAGSLARMEVAAAVAARLMQDCIAAAGESNGPRAARIQADIQDRAARAIAAAEHKPPSAITITAGPNAMCQEELGRFMPAGDRNPYDRVTAPGLPASMGENLIKTCLQAAQSVIDVKLARRASDAIDQAHPTEDTIEGWERVFWYAQPPGGTAFITDRTLEANTSRNAYLAFVEHGIPGVGGKPGIARARKAAATRFVDEIDAAYAQADYLDPPSARQLCKGHYSTPGQVALDTIAGTHTRTADETHDVLTKLRSLTDLSAFDAQNWMTIICRQHSDALLAKRLDAAKPSGVAGVFAAGEKLSVRDKDGTLYQIDPAMLAQSAAVDGLQVRFVAGGMFSSARMVVTPFGRDAPRLASALQQAKRADDVPMLVVENIGSLPGIDGPLATLQCIGMPVAQESFNGRLQLIGGVLSAWSRFATDSARQDLREGRDTMASAQDCAHAKEEFARN